MALFRKSADKVSQEDSFAQAKELFDTGDYAGCFDIFRFLAKKGHPESQLILGDMYERGLGTMSDSESALKWFRQCPLPEGKYRRGHILVHDGGVLGNIPAGLQLYLEAAEAGCPEAIIELGMMHEAGDGVKHDPAESARLYRIGADNGNAECQFHLAELYRTGRGVVRSMDKAVDLYFKSANQGNHDAECAVGELYAQGEGVKKSPEDAEKWLMKAADKQHRNAQCQLGWLYHTGALGEKDQEAMKWYRLAAEQGDGTAQNNIGVLYESARGVPESPYEAAKWYKRASDSGNAFGMLNMGRLYYTGKGVVASDSDAARYFLMAADKGNLEALQYLSELNMEGRGTKQDFNAASKYARKVTNPINTTLQFYQGWLYEKGIQVPQSNEDAAKWYTIAANNGSAAAQCNLGLMYETGKGVEQSHTEAFRYYKKAADCGNSNAQYNVALMYDKGRGVEQSDEQAIRYYTLSAENGNAAAMCCLGLMYESGRGTVQSEEQAFRWYTKAIENGNKDAEEYLARLMGQEDDDMAEPERNEAPQKVEAVTETFSKFRPVTQTGVDFSQVKGLDDVKQEVNHQILQPYAHPDIYRRFRKKVGGGILLYGPPGTGKTMIAQAIATETHAVFFSVKCSDILSRWTGEAVANIRKLFTLARKQPRAVIFFDEFEALGRARTDDSRSWEDSLMAELLSQIQGFDQYDTNLIILAATNRPWDIDNALLRSGRFSRHIYVPLPDDDSRRAIIEAQLDGVPVGSTFDLEDAVRFTAGFNGADVVELCEQMKQSAINRSIRLSSDSEVISAEDAEFGKARTKCSVSAASTKRLEEFREAGF
ncbi:MAG: AAA family ATPase [archaeon]|nr:AAA family ATPase [archaeon]